MRKIGLKKRGLYYLGGAAIALMALFSKGVPAFAADTYGFFSVTTNGTKGEDFDFDESTNVLTVKSNQAITVSGANVGTDMQEKVGHILITGSSDVNLTISGLDIRHMEFNTAEAPIQIDDSYSGTATITIVGTSNRLSSAGTPAIQKNGDKSKLVINGSGSVKAEVSGLYTTDTAWPAVIGGAAGMSSGNIQIDNGTFTLNSYSGGACIGGGSSNSIGTGGNGTNIVINGGTITASILPYPTASKSILFPSNIGAAIGGGGNGDADGIYIHGGKVTASVTSKGGTDMAGAAIGGGCFGAGKNIVIDGGTVNAKVNNNTCGCGIGSGFKEISSTGWNNETSVSIGGGIVVASGVERSAGIGGYGSSSLADNATVTITGGRVQATGGQYAPGIGGGRCSNSKVYISGGNVIAAGGNSAKNSIGLENDSIDRNNKGTGDFKAELLRSAEDPKEVSLQKKTDESLAFSLVEVSVTDASGNAAEKGYYGINDMSADSTGTVYVYLPEGYTLKGISKAGEKKVDVSALEWNYDENTEFYYNNSNYSVTLKTIPQGVDVTGYTNNSGSAVGKYEASVILEAQDGYVISDTPKVCDWEIKEYVAKPTLTYNGSTTKADSYSGPVTIKAEGYYIGTNPKGTFASDEYVVSSTGTTSLYFKNKTSGYITTTAMNVDLTILSVVDISGIDWDYDDAISYDGSNHTVALKNVPAKGVDVKYSGTTTAAAVGTYTANVTLTPQSGYTLSGEFTKTELNWEIKEAAQEQPEKTSVDISKVSWDYSGPYTYTGSDYEVSVDVPEGVNVSYTGTRKASMPDEYTVSVTLTAQEGYELTGSFTKTELNWKIAEYDPASVNVKYNNADLQKWYDGNVKITAEGHTIRNGASGEFENSIIISNTDKPLLYFRNTANGYVTTTAIQPAINIDKTAPAGTINIDGESYSGISSSQTKICHLKNNSVTIEGTDSESGIKSVQYAVYTGSSPYTTEAEIEKANLTWVTNSTLSFKAGASQVIYAKITDNVGRVTYISTPLINDDSTAPVVSTVVLDGATADSLGYSIVFDDYCNYSYVLLKGTAGDSNAPESLDDIKSAVKAGNVGAVDQYGKELTGRTFDNLESNQSYVLYAAADDGRTSLSGESNPNVSAVKSSEAVTTLQKEITVSAQTKHVQSGIAAATYTYNLKDMLSDSGADVDSLGTISYEAVKGAGSILAADPVIKGDNLSISVGTGIADNLTQDITVTFKFGNSAYKNAQAVLTIVSDPKIPLTLASSVTISDKDYDGTANAYSGEVVWVDNEDNPVKVNATDILYTGYEYSETGDQGNAYSSVEAPVNAGVYKVTFSVPDSDNNYKGSAAKDFVIRRVDLSKKMDSVTWLINGEPYEEYPPYYAKGETYSVTVTGLPEELVVDKYTGNTASASGTYEAFAKYKLASGKSAGNYKLPEDSTLIWKLEFFDNVAPTGKIVLNSNAKTYESVNTSTEVLRVHESSITADITGADEHSAVSKIEYAFADGVYSSKTAIENAGLTWTVWTKGSTCRFTDNTGKALYVRVTDEPGNVAYVSTPVIYNDTEAPEITTAPSLSNATETSINYSFTLNESAYYHAVLLKSSDTEPKSAADINDAIAKGNPGFSGNNNKASGTFKNLTPNQAYVLYVVADDGLKTLSGDSNANVSAVKKSSAVATKQKEIKISDQVFQVKKGLAARSYTYDLYNMLSSSVSSDLTELGEVTYTAKKESGNIIESGSDVSVSGSVLTIPVGSGFDENESQDVTVTFTFANNSYKSTSAKLTVKSVSKIPLSLSGISAVGKVYDGESWKYSGDAVWKDGDGNTVTISGTEISYTGTLYSGNTYAETTAAPVNAGSYTLTVKIPDNNDSYTGAQTFDFTISRIDLDSQEYKYMDNLKWYIKKGDSNGEIHNPDKVYYADGTQYTVYVDGYPKEVKPSYSGEYSGSEAKTYHADVSFEIAAGYDENNYELPDDRYLTWVLKEKQENPDIEKTTPDVSSVEWKYYKYDKDGNKSELKSDAEFIEEDGSVYEVVIDKATLPTGIDRENIIYTDSSNSATGKYTAYAEFSVVDEDMYNVPEKVSHSWEIHKDKGGSDGEEKEEIDLTGYYWEYVNGDTRDRYAEDMNLTENGKPYSVEIANLPEGVYVEKYTTVLVSATEGEAQNTDSEGNAASDDNSRTTQGLYETTAFFGVNDSDNYKVPEPIAIRWRIKASDDYTVTPVPVDKEDKGNENQDSGNGSGQNNDTVVNPPAVGSVSTYSGGKYKVLTTGEQGGTVEYDGQAVVNKKVIKITIPATVTIEGRTYKVTAIKNGTFNGYKKLQKVTIGKYVTKIGDKAFYKCTGMKTVTIPANVTTIGKNAFYGCKKLTKIIIKSKKLKKVGNNAIKGINKKATIKCPTKKIAKKYKKLFKSKTGFKKTMKIK